MPIHENEPDPTPPAPQPEGDWFAVATIAQDMQARGLAEQVCGEELLKLANSNRSQPSRFTTPPAQDVGWCNAMRPAAPAAPEPPAEALAVRPLLEQVARLGECIGANTVGQITAISDRAVAWLEQNPAGQPVAIEPCGCPTPGTCSCVEPTPPALVPGEAGELVVWLQSMRELAGEHNPEEQRRYDRAAALLQQLSDLAADAVAGMRYIEGSHGRLYGVGWDRVYAKANALNPQPSAPAPVMVPVPKAERLPGVGDCDAEGRCWVCMPRRATPTPNWTLLWKGHFQPYHSHWLPAHAIPLPQVGEVEG